MKLTSMTINNLFSYNGAHEVNFDHITCIIGTNGFGKTSILNAIKLCLGQSSISINSILNNNAKEKLCSITLKFDEFTIVREWSFEEKVEESLNITFEDNNSIESAEAEHYIQNKIPSFLIEFLFYDGEIGNNLFLLSRTKLKNLFDFVFDLDLLSNVQKDALQVSKNLLERNKDAETSELIELENKRLDILDFMSKQKDALVLKTKESKALALNIQKLDTQIRNRSKKVNHLHDEQDQKQEELNVLSTKLKEQILFQMPLLLNNKLLKGIEERTHSPLKVNDEKLFESHFKRFLDQINTTLDEEDALSIFKSLMLTESASVKLSLSREEFLNLLTQMKDIKYAIQKIQFDITSAESSSMEQEFTRSLVESRTEQQELLSKLEAELQEIDESIKTNGDLAKEINRTITQSFKENQEKFAFIKGYEELQQIARVSEKVYQQELSEKLALFNEKLKDNTASFLKQYKHINDISIDEKHNIVITDGDKSLNIELLSAGQKQVLNFLIVKSILEFKKFASFVMVDTPFGRLSNANKKLLLNECYRKFDNLILLVTDSEFEFIQSQNLTFDTYHILRNDLGSTIEKAS